ncbi:MAG: FlgD immunoglobulin-like domain containing protein, partial [Bacteroidota bacterium]
MRKTLLLLTLTLFGAGSGKGQAPTFAEDVAPLIYQHCAHCHNVNGIAPMPLTSYQDVYQNRFLISVAVQNKLMPPWPPAPDYQHFAGENYLEDGEIATIKAWVDNMAPRGDSTLEPPPPVFSTDGLLGTPDLALRIPTYTSQATTNDDYVCITLDPGLATTKRIKSIEVIPGNRQILHHVLIYLDSSGTYQPGTALNGCTGPGGGRLLGAYVPGQQPIRFPNGDNVKMGITLHPNEVVVLAMHYPEGSLGQVDSTVVNFHFYDDAVTQVREIQANSLIEEWAFLFFPGDVQTISGNYGPLSQDWSLLSVFPHCHLLGKSWLVKGEQQNNDTIPIIHIPHWDFEWQGFYFFDYIKKLPQGTRLRASCTYDNSSTNPHNPNNPPAVVTAGLNTSNEMFIVYFHYLPYEPGDEFINLDSLQNLPTPVTQVVSSSPTPRITPFPNPAVREMTLDYYLPKGADIALEIRDLQGRRIRRVWSGKQAAGQYHARWDLRTDQGARVARGLY